VVLSSEIEVAIAEEPIASVLFENETWDDVKPDRNRRLLRVKEEGYALIEDEIKK
jgi:hypothetical protein